MRAAMVAVVTSAVMLAVGAAGVGWADKATPKADKPMVKVAAKPAAVKVAAAVGDAPQVSKRVLAQQDAMKALAFLDGEWRGTVKTLRKEGWTSLTQTVRSGVMLDGTVRMVEVKSYEADGRVSFEALRIISFDPDRKVYAMRSYQGGAPRDVTMEASANGVAWTIESRGTSVRYQTNVGNGAWTETATRTPKDGAAKDGKAEAYLSVSMKRLRASSWPVGGAVAAK